MRILLDAHMVGHRETGNESYVTGLLAGLAQLKGLAVGAAVDPMAALPASLKNGNLTMLPLPGGGNWSRLLVGLNRLAGQWQADVLHASYIAPFFPSCPVVISVHDVSFKRYPSYFSQRDRLLLATLLPWSLRRAAAVITLSEHARSEINHFFPALSAPVSVIPLAAAAAFRPLPDETVTAVRRRYQLPDRFLLAVGNLQPRKNLLLLVEAFSAVQADFPDLHLVIVGQDWWQSSAVYNRVDALKLAAKVHFTGYIAQEDLVGLYNAAALFVYPSVYEGFGLPVLEAMACGCPVIASNSASLPEVAGEAAVLVDPNEARALAAAIGDLLSSPLQRAELGHRGIERASQFSWQKTAQATAAVYRNVASG